MTPTCFGVSEWRNLIFKLHFLSISWLWPQCNLIMIKFNKLIQQIYIVYICVFPLDLFTHAVIIKSKTEFAHKRRNEGLAVERFGTAHAWYHTVSLCNSCRWIVVPYIKWIMTTFNVLRLFDCQVLIVSTA